LNISTVIGARPQFVKAAVVSQALKNAGIIELIIHTGQHYDEKMSQIFWEELSIPEPHKNLEIGSYSHSLQTAKIMMALENEFAHTKPSAVMVYGDTNSTLAAALVASKMNIPLIHIEAGLRSFNREMPEEINRIVTDTLSSLLFCSSDEGVKQLRKEGITVNVFEVGDVMYDAFERFKGPAISSAELYKYGIAGNEKFALATIHRPSNTDNLNNLTQILGAFSELDYMVYWPVHPRNKINLERVVLPKNIRTLPPLSYIEMQSFLHKSAIVFTDSGGLQKEAYWARKPCVTLRNETEWSETTKNNWNILAGPVKENILKAVKKEIDMNSWKRLYGDGNSAERIAKKVKEFLVNG